MTLIKKEGIILKKTELGFENEGVLNPAVIAKDSFIHVFYRAVAQGNYSSIGYCSLSDPLTLVTRSEKPLIPIEFDYERHGVEDPRIVKIDDLYYLTYTAYDGENALGALAVSKDLVNFEKKGFIVPKITFDRFCSLVGADNPLIERYKPFNLPLNSENGNRDDIFMWDKNIIFFPRKIEGKFYILHRIKPDIQLIAVDSLSELTEEFWEKFFKNFQGHILFSPEYAHETSYIGGGCPPIETELGWLMIYHGVHKSDKGNVYSAGAALLDLDDPRKVIARLPYPLFEPEFNWELTGEVNNVCFPTGTVLKGDTLYIYYGAADEQIAVASVSLSDLLKELTINSNKINQEN